MPGDAGLGSATTGNVEHSGREGRVAVGGGGAAGGAGGLDAGSPPAAGVFVADGSVGELADGCFSSGSFAMN